MRIERLRAKDVWSFGEAGIDIEISPSTTVLIGRNNHGKSNVLRALQWPSQNIQWLGGKQGRYVPSDLVRFNPGARDRPTDPSLSITFSMTPQDVEGVLGATPRLVGDAQGLEQLRGMLSKPLTVGMSSGWVGPQAAHCPIKCADGQLLLPPDLSGPANSSKAVAYLDSLKSLAEAIAQVIGSRTTRLSGWRRLADQAGQDKTYTQLLHAYAAPKDRRQEKRQIFNRIQGFFRTLTGDPDTQLVPAEDGASVSVESRGRTLPLESYGDGLQHLLLMAFEIARSQGHLILIEEPETHLHPALQRHLLRFIKDDGRNQFVLTTHSPVLLDTRLADLVYRVEHDGEQSRVTKCAADHDVYHVLDQLDVRASDLLQANLVIWVEGPSDRVFIKRCLDLWAEENKGNHPDLVEGLHYQFVYYGGAIRTHLQFGDANPSLINLLRLSRHAVMVWDSDCGGPKAPVNTTKSRLHDECQRANCLSWMTQGREIENYLHPDALNEAYKGLLSDTGTRVEFGQFDDVSKRITAAIPNPPEGKKWAAAYDGNKVRLMEEFVQHMTCEHLAQLDLRSRIKDLVEAIEKANPSPSPVEVR